MFQDLLNEWIKYWEEKYHEKIDMSQMGNAINFASWLDTRSPTLRAPAEAGGEYCICEKPLDDDGWRCIRCGKLMSPRLGG